MDPIIKIGHPVPTFCLPDLQGNEHRLEDYQGKILVLHFWSAECPWVARVDETLVKMRSEWGEQVVVLSIAANANETQAAVAEVAEIRGVAPMLLDSEQKVACAYGAQVTPHFFVIGQQGVLRYQGGFDDVTFRNPEPSRNYLWEAVEAILAEENPEIGEMPAYGCTIVFDV